MAPKTFWQDPLWNFHNSVFVTHAFMRIQSETISECIPLSNFGPLCDPVALSRAGSLLSLRTSPTVAGGFRCGACAAGSLWASFLALSLLPLPTAAFS